MGKGRVSWLSWFGIKDGDGSGRAKAQAAIDQCQQAFEQKTMGNGAQARTAVRAGKNSAA